MKLKSHSGFTLIELVIVLVLLSILATTAIPKFVNLSSDAKISALESVAGAVLSTDSLVMSKAKVEGVTSTNQITNIPGTELYILGEHMSITPEHLKNAMHLQDFIVTEYWQSVTFSTFIYLGDEKLGIPRIKNSPCYIHLSRTFRQGSNKVNSYSDLNIYRSYDGC